MNKKISLIVALLAIVMVLSTTMGIVNAGKGQEKLSFQIKITTINEPVADRIIRCSPTWETPPAFGGDAKVVFVELEYIASDLSVTIGDDDPIVPTNVLLSNGVLDTVVYWNVPIPFSKVFDKDEFTLDFSELFSTTAKIEIRRLGWSDQVAGTSSGTFVGQGTDYLAGVKVSGVQTEYTGSMMSTSFQLTGTIMGWPGLL